MRSLIFYLYFSLKIFFDHLYNYLDSKINTLLTDYFFFFVFSHFLSFILSSDTTKWSCFLHPHNYHFFIYFFYKNLWTSFLCTCLFRAPSTRVLIAKPVPFSYSRCSISLFLFFVNFQNLIFVNFQYFISNISETTVFFPFFNKNYVIFRN